MSNPRVLLVDDDEDYAMFVKRLLSRMGYEYPLDVVHDEATALRALEEREYDIVVSDYDLNPGSGVRILEQVRRLSPKAQRILLTSAPDKARKHLAESSANPHGLWDKRWELGTIREQLRGLFRPTT